MMVIRDANLTADVVSLMVRTEELEAIIIVFNFQTKNDVELIDFCCFLGEAHQLAGDFRTVCESDFPTKITADYVGRHHSDPNEISTRRNMVLAAK